MNNIVIVTDYLRSIGQESMVIVYTKDNKPYLKVDDNTYYRVYEFVQGTICYEVVTSDKLLIKDGEAFGKLHKDLQKLDATKLKEVIKDFHNTPKRYADLVDAINLNSCNRLFSCKDEVARIQRFKNELSLIIDGINDKSIHYVTTHNDPKINNVLFDMKTDAVRCVIDLDTIMPGSCLYDIGDSFRSLFTGDNEDSKDLSKIVVNFDIFTKYLQGYLGEMKSFLTKREIELIPYSVFLLTIECAIRFLEDYLRGDVYFHTEYDEHNLVRSRTQITLAEKVYASFDKMKSIVDKILNEN